ncbi:MAG: alpha-amylase family glycosyl hydrolase [Lacibacter sp.]
MKRILLLLIALPLVLSASAQLLSFSPDFPLDNSNVTITMDATKGNKGLMGYTGDVFVHIGVITNLSSSSSDWKYVKTTWGSTDVNYKANVVSSNVWSFTINNVRSYFSVPAGETILRIAILFRSGSGSIKQANTDGSDMYVPVYAPGVFAVRFTSPAMQPTYNMVPEPVNVTIPATIPVTAVTSANAAITLRYDGTQIGSAASAQTVSGTANVTTECNHKITVEAFDNTTYKRDTIGFAVTPVTYPTGARPAGFKDGITYDNNNTEAVLILYAPLKSKVIVLGDFNNWTESCESILRKDGDYFWTRITGLTPGTNYRFQYVVDDAIRFADPYSELVLDPNNDQYISPATYPNMPAYPTGKTTGGIVGVLTPGETAYTWTSNSYARPDKRDLLIYELLVRDFTSAKNWQTLKDTLGYIKRLGFNAIELMPINEFDGNESWGYNPYYFFAPDKAYGTKNALKAFIDQAHSLGIAVIQDIAFNHATGQSPLAMMWWNSTSSQPAANSPYFYETAQHPFNVFNDFNHNTAATKYHTARFIRHWLTEYKIDGFRWDLSKGFTNQNCAGNQSCWDAYNADRINIWKRYYDSMQVVSNGSYCIMEHLGGDQEEAELATYGMMFWGNHNYAFNQNTMGYSSGSDINRAYWRNRGSSGSYWNSSNLLDKPHLITYAESHDEERLMYKNILYGATNGSYNVKDTTTGLRRNEAAAAVLLGIPGPKMIWQYGELGYDYSINYCTTGGTPGTVNNNCRLDSKPIRWDYYQQQSRRRLYDLYSAMAKLRQQKPLAFRSFSLASGTDLGSNLVKIVAVDHIDLKYVVVANFDVSQQTPSVTFPATGTWYDYTNGGSITVSSAAYSVSLAPGEYKVYLNENIAGGIVSGVSRDIVATNSNFRLSVYPNPVQNAAIVKYELPKSGKVSLQLINMQGQVLVSKNLGFQLKGLQAYELNNSLAGYPLVGGQYILQVRVDNVVRNEKIIIEQQ